MRFRNAIKLRDGDEVMVALDYVRPKRWIRGHVLGRATVDRTDSAIAIVPVQTMEGYILVYHWEVK